MKTSSLLRALWAILTLAALLFTACPTGSDNNGSSQEEPTISNITYSSVSGGDCEWTLQSDGSRKSPAIGNNDMTKAQVSFTSKGRDASITIQLRVPSYYNWGSGGDYAFISPLNNPYWKSSRDYICRPRAATGTRSRPGLWHRNSG